MFVCTVGDSMIYVDSTGRRVVSDGKLTSARPHTSCATEAVRKPIGCCS